MRSDVNIIREICITLLLAISIAAMLLGRQSTACNADGGAEWRTVEVLPGDTLWDLSRRYGLPGSDPRPTLKRILAANHRTSSLIEPGDVIAVPVTTRGGAVRSGEREQVGVITDDRG